MIASEGERMYIYCTLYLMCYFYYSLYNIVYNCALIKFISSLPSLPPPDPLTSIPGARYSYTEVDRVREDICLYRK